MLKKSPCHDARINAARSDGVMVGSCDECGANVVRINPQTGVEEFLDGNSPWTEKDLRPVND